jgi:hypothetical protein
MTRGQLQFAIYHGFPGSSFFRNRQIIKQKYHSNLQASKIVNFSTAVFILSECLLLGNEVAIYLQL